MCVFKLLPCVPLDIGVSDILNYRNNDFGCSISWKCSKLSVAVNKSVDFFRYFFQPWICQVICPFQVFIMLQTISCMQMVTQLFKPFQDSAT